MVKYYIVLDDITEDNLLNFSLYKFDTEHDAKPIQTSTEKFETIERLISIMEDLVANYGTQDICIVSNTDDLINESRRDNIIRNCVRIMFRHNIGYRVIYIPYSNNGNCSVVELIDTSASGILRYLKKLKYYM